MKKVIVITLLNFITITLLLGQNLLQDKPQLLMNKIVKPIQNRELSYNNFYLKFNQKTKKFYKVNGKTKPEYSKIVGQEFEVIAVHEIYVNPYYSDKLYAIEIKNEKIGTIFYKYNSAKKSKFEFEVVGGIELPEGFFCEEIVYEYNKYNKVHIYTTPEEKSIVLKKYITNNDTVINFTMKINVVPKYKTDESNNVLNATQLIQKFGLYLFLSDSTVISRPNIMPEAWSATNKNYEYSLNGTIKLSENEIKLLSKNTIDSTKASVYTQKVNIEHAFKIKEFVKCISK